MLHTAGWHNTFVGHNPLLDSGDLLFYTWPVPQKIGYCLPLCSAIFNWLWKLCPSLYPICHCKIFFALCTQTLTLVVFIYTKCLIGLVPSCLCVNMCTNKFNHGLHSSDVLQMLVPRARTELVKKAVKYAAPSAWNTVQKHPKLSELVNLGEFKVMLKDREDSALGQCNCLWSYIFDNSQVY